MAQTERIPTRTVLSCEADNSALHVLVGTLHLRHSIDTRPARNYGVLFRSIYPWTQTLEVFAI